MNVLSLCTGIGGIELGLRLVLGERVRVVGIVEREAYCLEVLAARCREGWLDDAPVFTDLRTFDGRAYAGRVDLVTAGYPCQPHSVAGKRRGAEDERNLWPDVRRIVAEVQPALVFLENVPGALRFTFEHVLPDLRRLGYGTSEGLFSAAEVGAPQAAGIHIFLLACAKRPRLERPIGSTISRKVGLSQLGRSTAWGPEPAVGRVATGLPHRVDRLAALGNSVVPLVAAHAFRTLAADLG